MCFSWCLGPRLPSFWWSAVSPPCPPRSKRLSSRFDKLPSSCYKVLVSEATSLQREALDPRPRCFKREKAECPCFLAGHAFKKSSSMISTRPRLAKPLLVTKASRVAILLVVKASRVAKPLLVTKASRVAIASRVVEKDFLGRALRAGVHGACARAHQPPSVRQSPLSCGNPFGKGGASLDSSAGPADAASLPASGRPCPPGCRRDSGRGGGALSPSGSPALLRGRFLKPTQAVHEDGFVSAIAAVVAIVWVVAVVASAAPPPGDHRSAGAWTGPEVSFPFCFLSSR